MYFWIMCLQLIPSVPSLCFDVCWKTIVGNCENPRNWRKVLCCLHYFDSVWICVANCSGHPHFVFASFLSELFAEAYSETRIGRPCLVTECIRRQEFSAQWCNTLWLMSHITVHHHEAHLHIAAWPLVLWLASPAHQAHPHPLFIYIGIYVGQNWNV